MCVGLCKFVRVCRQVTDLLANHEWCEGWGTHANLSFSCFFVFFCFFSEARTKDGLLLL